MKSLYLSASSIRWTIVLVGLFLLPTLAVAHHRMDLDAKTVILALTSVFILGSLLIAYPILSFLFALNGAHYSDTRRKRRLWILGVLALVTASVVFYQLFDNLPVIAGLIFLSVPLTWHLAGVFQKKLRWGLPILMVVYLGNFVLLKEGVYHHPELWGLVPNPRISYHNGSEQVYQVVNYKKGKLHGAFEEYNKEGQLVFIGTYDQGSKNGHWKHYDAHTGRLEEEGSYQRNRKHGTWKFYDYQGGLRRIQTFSQGTLHGPFQVFNRKGILLQEGTYQHGEKIIDPVE